MPKSATPQQIIRLLKREGFVLKRIRGSHHIFHHSVTNRRIIVSLHKKDLPKVLYMGSSNLLNLKKKIYNQKWVGLI